MGMGFFQKISPASREERLVFAKRGAFDPHVSRAVDDSSTKKESPMEASIDRLRWPPFLMVSIAVYRGNAITTTAYSIISPTTPQTDDAGREPNEDALSSTDTAKDGSYREDTVNDTSSTTVLLVITIRPFLSSSESNRCSEFSWFL